MPVNGSPPPIDAWQVASMRITAFPSEVVLTDRLSWWDDAVGLPPETVVSRPKAGQYQAQGEFEGRRLTLQIQPGRVEWRVSAVLKETEEAPDLRPLLGPFTEVLTSLSKVVRPWLPQAPAMTRFAFGAVLVQPVENKRAGYILMTKYLPSVAIDPDGSSDFLYQINRPRSSATGVEGLRINRLARWSVQVAQQVVVTLGADIAARALNEETACRLDLDINTAPDFGRALPAGQMAALFQELIDLGREIAESGDLP